MVDPYASSCPCGCHTGGPYQPCTVIGGCGHLHTTATLARCRRGDRCAEWEWDDPTAADRVRVGRAINTTDGLCLACTGHTAITLAELPRDYVELHTLLGRVGGTIGEPVTRSRALPVPIRLDVEATLTAIVAETTCWAEAVAERLGITWDSNLVDHHTRPGVALSRAARLLSAAVSPWLAVRDWTRMVWLPDGWTALPESRDGIDGAIALIELRHHTRRLCGLTRLRHRMPAGCPRCERRTLVRDDGDEDVWCTACAAVFRPEHYRELVSVLAGVW